MKYLAETMINTHFPKKELEKFVTDPSRFENKDFKFKQKKNGK